MHPKIMRYLAQAALIILLLSTPIALAQSPLAQPTGAADSMMNVLFVANSTTDSIMVLDPQTGDVIDPYFLDVNIGGGLSTPGQALMHPDNQRVLVLDQFNDIITAYDLAGHDLGVWAPQGGANADIMDAPHSMTWLPNGQMAVTVGLGANADSVILFDQTGAYQGRLISPTNGLDSPYDLFVRDNDLLTTQSSGGVNNFRPLKTFTFDGTFISNFSSVNRFPQQIAQARNGNILVADFVGDQTGILEYTNTPTGTLVARYDDGVLPSYRGVYDLPNNNLLVATGLGLYELTRSNTVTRTIVMSESLHYIEEVSMPRITDLTLTSTITNTQLPTQTLTVPWLQPFTTTLIVSQTRAFSATDAVLTATLPLNMQLVGYDNPRGDCSGSGLITCTLGTLLKDDTVTLTLQLTPQSTGPQTIMLGVSSPELDTNPANNTLVIALVAEASIRVYLPYVAKPAVVLRR